MPAMYPGPGLVEEMMMREARQVVAAFFERLWNGRELDLAEEIIAPDCTTHQL